MQTGEPQRTIPKDKQSYRAHAAAESTLNWRGAGDPQGEPRAWPRDGSEGLMGHRETQELSCPDTGTQAQHSQRGTVTILSPGVWALRRAVTLSLVTGRAPCPQHCPYTLYSKARSAAAPEKLFLTSSPAPLGKHPPSTAGPQIHKEERGKESIPAAQGTNAGQDLTLPPVLEKWAESCVLTLAPEYNFL